MEQLALPRSSIPSVFGDVLKDVATQQPGGAVPKVSCMPCSSPSDRI